MKSKDIKSFDDNELRNIYWKLKRNDVDSLPEILRDYINTENTSSTPIGNKQTRMLRLMNLITEEINSRFMHGELHIKQTSSNEILLWFNKRIADTQAEYNAININDMRDEFGNIIDYGAFNEMLTKGGKLRGYKDSLAYLISHLDLSKQQLNTLYGLDLTKNQAEILSSKEFNEQSANNTEANYLLTDSDAKTDFNIDLS